MLKYRGFYRALGLIAAFAAIILLAYCIPIEYRNVGLYPENSAGVTLCINEVMFQNLGTIRDEDGDISDWIEIYNYGSEPVNLSGVSIADHVGEKNRWFLPEKELQAGEYMLIWASGKNKITDAGELHTDFMIRHSETITLYYGSECIDKLYFSEAVDPGLSVGRTVKDPQAIALLSKGTPLKPNKARAVSFLSRVDDSLEAPEFSSESGVYASDFYLTLSTTEEDALIYYTIDGSVPDRNSSLYSEPILICDRSGEAGGIGDVKTTPNYRMNYYWENTYDYKGTVVRARTCKDGVMSDAVTTKSYFINPKTEFNIVSLSVDPAEFFDERSGLYVPGETYYTWKNYNKESTNTVFPPGNYDSEDKVKAHLDIFDRDGTLKSGHEVQVSIMGAASRSYAAKGLKAVIDEDNESFDADVFELLPQDEVTEGAVGTDSVIMRASGSDFNKSMFCDILAQSIVADRLNVTYQAAQPAVLFINGEYWGIHNLRENYSEDYFQRHFGIAPKDMALIKLNTDVSPYVPEINCGSPEDLQDYLDLVEYVQNHDLSDRDGYEYVCQRIDVDNFIDYFITEIYYGNDDWPGNNFRIWRATDSENEYGDNRWRMVLFDLDDAFLYPEFNSVEYVLNEDYDREVLEGINLHYDGNRELINALMQNTEFSNRFFARFEECLDTVFSTENVLEHIDELKQVYDSEMTDHFKRWHTKDGWLKRIKNKIKNTYSEADLYTYDRWEQKVDSMRTFATERPGNLQRYIDEYRTVH